MGGGGNGFTCRWQGVGAACLLSGANVKDVARLEMTGYLLSSSEI